jgi:competence protein ComEC
MVLFILAFLAGDCFLQSSLILPNKEAIFLVFIIGILVTIWFKKYCRFYYLFLAFILGHVWAAWYANDVLSWSLAKGLEGVPVVIRGHVASVPNTGEGGTQFLFQPKELNHLPIKSSILFRLYYRTSEKIRVGDEWQFLAKLKRIHGIQSPLAFDEEAWALQKGLRAHGYIIPNKQNRWLSHASYRFIINQYRQALKEKIEIYLPHTPTAPWLLTLMLGEHNGVLKEDWQVLRRTGTNHLMAIAGLHIGIVAGLTHWLVNLVWRRFPYLLLRMPASEAGALASLFIAAIYSALAGFSVPTQRALTMLSIFIFTLLLRRKINIWYSWAYAILLTLILNPLSLLTESFWLSFGTIALLLYGMNGRLSSKGWWWHWGRAQWVISIGLIPLTLIFFQECSLASVLVNSIAIPWLSFLILPLCLLSIVCMFFSHHITHFLLILADKNLAILWMFLSWMAKLPWSSWHQVILGPFIFITMLIGILCLLAPRGFPFRWIGIIWLLPSLLCKQAVPKTSEVWFTLLDVGQGLSAIIQTKNHLLVYDAGPKYGPRGPDMGERVVVPYLNSIGINHIDKLIISHSDNDHAGGVNTLLDHFNVDTIFVSEKKRGPLLREAVYCLANFSWQWDGVTFSFLYPTKEMLQLKNDSSCVLRIDNGTHVILLTGDIEKYAEAKLLDTFSNKLSSQILIAPHHGSKTSSTDAFISSVRPQFVLYATGYRNRYHFPHPKVISAYNKIGAEQFNTAETGTVHFKIGKEQSKIEIQPYRLTHQNYWKIY